MVVTITPEDGMLIPIAKLLIALADHPHQVRYVSHPAAGFEVPEELYKKFEASFRPETSDVESSASDEQTDTDSAPAKRRGRPRKQQGKEE